MTPEERIASQKRCDEAIPGADNINLLVDYIAHARTDLPAALKDLEAADKRIAELEMRARDTATGRYPVLVVCALIIRDGAVLLERHAPSYGKQDHFWDIPGGKVECGETPAQAIVREVQEEIRVTIEPLRLLDTLHTSSWMDRIGTRHWVLAAYECRIADGEPALSDDLQWHNLDLLTDESIKSEDLAIIRAFVRERDEAREKLAAAVTHQQETDARVINQREEIKRQADEIEGLTLRLANHDKWKRESEQWQNKDSAFWKISELETKLAAAEHENSVNEGAIRILGSQVKGLVESLKQVKEALAASELAMAQVRAAVEDLPHTKNCHSEYGHAVPCSCITSCIKSRIPTGPDSPLVEAVKRLVSARSTRITGDESGRLVEAELSAASDDISRLAPDSWKQPKGRTE